MILLELSVDVEKHFEEIVNQNYSGNFQDAIKLFLTLHDKYAWKEILKNDVASIQAEVKRKGGISSEEIDSAIRKYRKNLGTSNK